MRHARDYTGIRRPPVATAQQVVQVRARRPVPTERRQAGWAMDRWQGHWEYDLMRFEQ
jgi:hypothetical protein